MVIKQEFRVEILSTLCKRLYQIGQIRTPSTIMKLVCWDDEKSLIKIKLFLWKAIKNNGRYKWHGYTCEDPVEELKTAYEELVRIAKNYDTDI